MQDRVNLDAIRKMVCTEIRYEKGNRILDQKEIEEVKKMIKIDLEKNRERNRKELRRRMEAYQRRFLKEVMKKEKN